MSTPEPPRDEPATPRPGRRTLAAVAALYAAAAAVATWPRVTRFATELPSLTDPLQHLWIMRWYRTCLLEGRSPLLCPEIQYPTGAPIGNFSPLHLQALLYLPLSFLTKNDALIYNCIWLVGIVTTGLATFGLAWWVVRDRRAAVVAGLLAMLSGPMMTHALAHLELIYLGGFPLFLLGWMRFVDRPSGRRLAAAAGLYLLLAACAAYYALLATLPAILYIFWPVCEGGPREVVGRLRGRLPWLAGFAAAVLPGLALAFGGQIWSMAHGYSQARPIEEFRHYGAAWWSYATPTLFHRLGGRWLSADPYPFEVWSPIESVSYLGVVGLGLLAYAAAMRVGFRRAGYWWASLALLFVLSLGAEIEVAGRALPLPSLWLREYGQVFKLIRVPARFNLLAAVCAAVIAAAGLRDLLGRLPGRRAPAMAGALLVGLTVADLSMSSFSRTKIPDLPACYEAIRRREPGAVVLDVPQLGSGCSDLSALCAYWQSQHRSPSNAGYSGQTNVVHDNLVYWGSPFAALRLGDAGFRATADSATMDVCRADFDDYAWLYLTSRRFDYVVLHRSPLARATVGDPQGLRWLADRLAHAKVFEDHGATVFARSLLPTPRRPVLAVGAGWRACWDGGLCRVVEQVGRLDAFNPDPATELRCRIALEAFQRPRTVRLLADGRELGRWRVEAGRPSEVVAGPFRLPAGLQELTLESDGQSQPRRRGDFPTIGDDRPYSLKVTSIELAPTGTEASERARIAVGPESTIKE